MKRGFVILLAVLFSIKAFAIRKDIGKDEASVINQAIKAIPQIRDIFEQSLGDTSYVVMLPLDINLHNEPLKECVYMRVERRGYNSSDPARPYAPAKYWDAYFVKYDRTARKVVMVIKE